MAGGLRFESLADMPEGMRKLVAAGELPLEKFRASYGAWKNHVSHGNCYKLARDMDEKVRKILHTKEV